MKIETTMHKIKVAIVEHNEEFRSAITQLIHMQPDLEVVLQAENDKQLLKQLKTIHPNIVLWDIRLGDMETTARIKQYYPDLKIIAFSQSDFESSLVEMHFKDVKSFISKEDDHEELFKAIRTVHNGGIYMTDRSAEIVQRYFSLVLRPQNYQKLDVNLHERTIIKMIIQGLTSKQIGKEINKSHRTVEDIREKLYDKFKVKNKEQFIAMAVKWNLDLV